MLASSTALPLNPVLTHLPPSLIVRMTQLAAEQGALNLAEGLPDFDPPDWVQACVQQALQQPGWHQTTDPAGLPELRRWLTAQHHATLTDALPPDALDTVVTCGATEALYLALATVVQPGSEVVLLEPFYEPYALMVRQLGGVVRCVPLSFPHSLLQPDALRQAITPNTRALILNSPGNPTGRVFTKPELEEVATLAQRHGFWVISDEVYSTLVYGPHVHVPMASLPGMASCTLTVGSVSKSLSATGWRVGWVSGPKVALTPLATLHELTSAGTSSLLQQATALALPQLAQHQPALLADFMARRHRMETLLQQSQAVYAPMEGAYYAWVDARTLPGGHPDDETVAQTWIQRFGVSLVPGRTFFAQHGQAVPFVRLCFAKRLSTLQQAVQQVLSRG